MGMRQNAHCNKMVREALDNIAIVLVGPKHPENIGAAARIAQNMGISRLRVVADAPPEEEGMLKMATHNARHLVAPLALFSTVGEALAPFSLVIGTTAREGRHRRAVKTPRSMLPLVLPLLRKNQVAFLFGPEDRGLSNEDLRAANLLVTIPTAKENSSLNLAQAVAIVCHEMYYGLVHQKDGGDEGFVAPRQACVAELDGMYAHIEKVLLRISFLKNEDHAYWMGKVRKFLGRLGLRASEVRIVRGICRQFLWHEDRLRK